VAIASAALQIALLVYLQITVAVNLYPWNDFEAAGDGGKRVRLVPGFVALGIAQVACIAVTLLDIEAAMVLALAFYGGWLGVQIIAWWRPYLFGAPQRHREAHERQFGRTYRFLPAIGDHPVPDAMHVVLHALLAGVVATTAAALAD
jgi:hypothetical protein